MISVFGSKVGDDEVANVVSCMRSQWMGFGANVANFEEKFSKKYRVPNFAMVDSGSNALFMAVTLLDLPKGSEVIVPSFTWVSCAQAVIMAGCVPVFCDVDLRTMNVRREDIEMRRTIKTSAVMVVDYAGLAVDFESISDLGLPVIEDAAHAACSTYKGQACGTLGEIGIYSFDAVKNLTTGEGGGITTRSKEAIARARVLRYCGIGKSGFDAAIANAKGKSRWWEYNIQEPFIKMLPTNIAGGIGLAQLDHMDDFQAARKRVWDHYQKEFSSEGWLTTPVEAAHGDAHSYFTYCIRVPKRDELAHFLLSNDIYTTLRYHPLHLNSIYKQTSVRLKNSEILNEDCLSIPIHPRLSNEDLDRIVSLIKTFGEKRRF